MENSNSIFTEDEEKILEMTKRVRIDILKNMTKGGIPSNTAELRIINEVSTSLDKVVQDSASNRAKHNDVQNKEATNLLVAAALRSVREKKPEHVQNRIIELGSEHTRDNVVPGEMDINPMPLDPADFLEDGDE